MRPECEVTDIELELWNLVPKTASNDPENYLLSCTMKKCMGYLLIHYLLNCGLLVKLHY